MTGPPGPSGGWVFADLYEAIADAFPAAPAVIEADDQVLTWGELDELADAVAAHLLERGLLAGSRVAVCMRNAGAFLGAYLGAFKAAMVPANVNYRYGPAELTYLLEDAGAEAVLYHAEFRDTLALVRERVPGVCAWVEVADGTPGGPPPWAVDLDELRAVGAGRPDVARSGDDRLLLYTGGTTGMPKGVIWRQDDLFGVLLDPGNELRGIPVPRSVGQLVDAVASPGPRDLAACPYMHATGLFNQLMTLAAGGTSVIAPGRRFDPERLLDTAARHEATLLVIVGDVFARPLADALERAPGRWALPALRAIVSSGLTFSRDVKVRLLDALDDVVILDAFGSSEASGIGFTVSRRGHVPETARFVLSDRVRVLGDDGRWLPAGSDEVGLVALSGRLPVGYHGDDAKTAATFRTIDGVRWSVPGDRARVGADGTLQLLGRGASCINTGGEKVYPEEVDEVIRRHPSVADAACLGVPDERFGEVVAAAVSHRPGVPPLALDELAAHVRQHLAGYKAPRRLVVVDEVLRSPSGKLDHAWLRATLST